MENAEYFRQIRVMGMSRYVKENMGYILDKFETQMTNNNEAKKLLYICIDEQNSKLYLIKESLYELYR